MSEIPVENPIENGDVTKDKSFLEKIKNSVCDLFASTTGTLQFAVLGAAQNLGLASRLSAKSTDDKKRKMVAAAMSGMIRCQV